jgi:hypothetical protein
MTIARPWTVHRLSDPSISEGLWFFTFKSYTVEGTYRMTDLQARIACSDLNLTHQGKGRWVDVPADSYWIATPSGRTTRYPGGPFYRPVREPVAA